jgi:hypothetical protein
MNKYVMQPIDYKYISFDPFKDNSQLLIDVYQQNAKLLHSFITPTNDEYSTNVLFRMRSSQLKTIEDITQETIKVGIYNFLKIGIDELANEGVIGCYDFFPILMGNTSGLPFKRGVGQHIHHQVTPDRKCNVHLMIFPLVVNNPTSEYLSFTWTDNEYPLGSYDFTATSDFNKKLEQHYSNIKRDACGPTQQISFPKMNERLTVKFNGTNWLHSADHFSNNLYLGIVVNDYIKTL